MNQEPIIEFSKIVNENEINSLKNIVYSIFSKKDEKSTQYWKKVRSLFLQAMKNANLNYIRRNLFWLYVNVVISKALKAGEPLSSVEDTLRSFLRKRANDEVDKRPVEIERSKLNFENIKKYITGQKILDLGAGDGLLAQQIKNNLNKEVFLVDVVDYNKSGLPLILYEPGSEIPLPDNEVDTTILYTVLHHSDHPEYLLREAARVTKHRLVIKEAEVEKEETRMTNSFFDWFYNRVIGDEDINVPLNFHKIEEWKDILNSQGFEVVRTEVVGFDEPSVPEYHVYIIAEKIY